MDPRWAKDLGINKNESFNLLVIYWILVNDNQLFFSLEKKIKSSPSLFPVYLLFFEACEAFTIKNDGILTPRVTRVPFRDVAILTAIFADSRESEILDQKWLLSLNSIS